MITIQSVLDLFDRLNPLDQLDRLMLLIGVPLQYQPPPTLSIFQRQNVIIEWAAHGDGSEMANLVRGLESLIERQQNRSDIVNDAEAPNASQSNLIITIRIVRDKTRDPFLPIPQTEHAQLTIGDAYSIRFLASDNCYLTVLCFGTTGQIYRLFPNSFHSDSRVRGKQTYEIPAQGFTFIEGGPPGVEIIRAFATRRPHFETIVNNEDALPLYTNKDLNDLERTLASYEPNDRAHVSCVIDVRKGTP